MAAFAHMMAVWLLGMCLVYVHTGRERAATRASEPRRDSQSPVSSGTREITDGIIPSVVSDEMTVTRRALALASLGAGNRTA